MPGVRSPFRLTTAGWLLRGVAEAALGTLLAFSYLAILAGVGLLLAIIAALRSAL